VTGTVSLTGRLEHTAEQGNGVRATIYSRGVPIGTWSAHFSDADTRVARVEVRRGDIIDFVIDNQGDGGWDGFKWAPVVKALNVTGEGGKGVTLWASAKAFPTPEPEPATPVERYGAWERYTQVLLMSNEFVFVE
jgi:hypothetical protein